LLRPATRRYAARAALCGPALVALLFAAWGAESIWAAILASAGAGFLCVQLGFVAHDAGHGSVSSRSGINQLVGHIAFTLLNGLGFDSWRASHNAHHAYSQDESRDPDMRVDIALSLTPASARAKTGLGRRLLPYQAAYLAPVSLFFAHSLRLQSLGRSYADVARTRRDALLLPLHYGLWFAFPMLVVSAGLSRVLLVYLAASAVMGAYLAMLFWVNHVGMPTFRPEDDAKDGVSFLERQVAGTRNLRIHPALDFLFGGLNFQIEHHLVPECPGPRLRALQSLARPRCCAIGLPYQEEGPIQALASVTRHLGRIAREHGRPPSAAE
jgi:fatty acid desaturase